LAQAGFADNTIADGFSGREFSRGTDELVVEARVRAA
jgi:hypothetical protein